MPDIAERREWDTFDSRATCYCGESGHWSHMPCSSRTPHPPHVFNNRHCLYGPYKCAGIAAVEKAAEPWCPDHGYGCEPQNCPCGHTLRCDCRDIANEH